MTEAIWREFEKERIREEIIAEEVARRWLLEAEVRHELMIEHEMAMKSGGGISSPFMPKTLKEEKLVMSVNGEYGRGGEIRAFSGSTFQLGDSPNDNKKEVIVLGKPNDETVSGTKRKSTPPVSEDRSKKKVKEEWSCAICHVSTTSVLSLTQHLQGKKHRSKEAALVAQKTGANFGLGVATTKPGINPSSSLENKSETVKEAVDQTLETNKTSSTFDPDADVNKYEMCEVGALSVEVKPVKDEMEDVTAVVKPVKDDMEYVAVEVKPVKDGMEYVAVVVKPVKDDMACVAGDVNPVKDDMACVAAVVAEENNTITAGFDFPCY
ncbi:hypothetical protein L1987_29824 [Smallanthus sonchifolius]|uniref:Uncharacterized protein n=1 Tax=Smallanthus sonchifolius TaxID=185202 RepID=A0ACB9I1T3_9ASTR|nr:hypothetical protein L1987_29824 [Smallanthus sonchifolius]